METAARLNEQAANLRDVVVSSRATAQDALLNLMQSSGLGSKLSAATKTAMGKRGLHQVEVLKGALDRATDEAEMLVRDADSLRAQVEVTVTASKDAVDAAEAAKRCAGFRALGNVAGLCLLHHNVSLKLPLFFCRHVYKFLLGRKITFADFAFFDPIEDKVSRLEHHLRANTLATSGSR